VTDQRGVIGQREELTVAGRIAVRPDLDIGETLFAHPTAQALGFHFGTTVRPQEFSGAYTVLDGEFRGEDGVGTQPSGQWFEIVAERRRNQNHSVITIQMPTETTHRVRSHPSAPDDLGESMGLIVDRGDGLAPYGGTGGDALDVIAAAASDRQHQLRSTTEESQDESASADAT